MEKHAVQAIIGMLKSSVKAWIFGAAKLIGRLIINPDNEPFILPFGPQKCDLRESSLAKVESQRRNASNFHCLSPDYEIKETKNIYVDIPYVWVLMSGDFRDILDLFVCQLDQPVSDWKLARSKLIAPSAELFAHSIIFSLLLHEIFLWKMKSKDSLPIVLINLYFEIETSLIISVYWFYFWK